jgi:protein-S-isoprenylcysteine O-methyltransferase Ste14
LREPVALPASVRRGSKFYDLMIGLPLILFYMLSAWGRFIALGRTFSKIGSEGFHYAEAIGILSNISLLVVALLFIVGVMLRPPPIARARGWMPKLAALCGTYLVVALLLFVPHTAPDWLMTVSTAMVLLGSSFAAYAVFHLGRSVSLMAEARNLVTTGPYRAVRHPLYLGEEIAIAGCILQSLSPLSVFVFAVQLGFQFYRMSREEEILAQAFPEYRDYARGTWRILPGIY